MDQEDQAPDLAELESLDEDELVERAREDRRAFGILYDRYFDRIYQYIVRRVGDHSVAEDIAGAVWERALVAIERYEVRGLPFAAWLYRIAGNLVANHHRRRSVLSFVKISPQHGSSTSSSERIETREAVRDAMRLLSQSDQEILNLYYFAGMTPPEMADVLGCSVAAVHKRLHRARNRLRSHLEGDDRVS